MSSVYDGWDHPLTLDSTIKICTPERGEDSRCYHACMRACMHACMRWPLVSIRPDQTGTQTQYVWPSMPYHLPAVTRASFSPQSKMLLNWIDCYGTKESIPSLYISPDIHPPMY